MNSLSFARTALASTGGLLLVGLALPAPARAQDGPRPMTFLDVQHMRRAGSQSLSTDGRWMLYTIRTPDWQEAESQSDIHLVSVTEGVSSSRQMTFTDEKNETAPAFSRDGRFFLFLSNRDATGNGNRNQLYYMRPDGGEAQRLTDEGESVTDFAFSDDGRWWCIGPAGAVTPSSTGSPPRE